MERPTLFCDLENGLFLTPITILQNVVKLGKLNLVEWRRAVAQIEVEIIPERANVHTSLLQAIRRATETLPLITDWTIVFIIPTIPNFPFHPPSYQILAQLDSKGVKTKFLISAPRSMEPREFELYEEHQPPHSEEKVTWAKLEVLVKTSLVYSSLDRFGSTFTSPLKDYMETISSKLVTHPSKTFSRILIVFSDFVKIVTKAVKAHFPRPSVQSRSNLAPSALTRLSGGITLESVTIGSSPTSKVPNASSSMASTDEEEEIEVELNVIQICPIAMLEPWQTGSNCLFLRLGTPNCRTLSEEDARESKSTNKLHFDFLAAKLERDSQVLIGWSNWDLSHVTIEGPAAKHLVRRFYAIYAIQRSVFMVKEMVCAEMIPSGFGKISDIVTDLTAQSIHDETLEDLEMRVALEDIPIGDYKPKNMESGLDVVIEQLMWAPSSNVEFPPDP